LYNYLIGEKHLQSLPPDIVPRWRAGRHSTGHFLGGSRNISLPLTVTANPLSDGRKRGASLMEPHARVRHCRYAWNTGR